MCINKEKLCHGILSHVEKHNKLHDLSGSNGHFQKIMSMSFNSHLKRQEILSIYHIKTIFVWDSIDFNSYVSTCTSFPKISCCQLPHCDWLREVLTANHSQRRHSRCICLSTDFINVHGEVHAHESKILCHLFYFYTTDKMTIVQ